MDPARRVLEALLQSKADFVSLDDLRHATGLSESDFDEAVKTLRTQRFITKGNHVTMTPLGRHVVDSKNPPDDPEER